MRASVFKYDEISAVGGQLLVQTADKSDTEFATAGAGNWFYFTAGPYFTVNDIVRVKTFDGTNVLDVWGHVIGFHNISGDRYCYCVYQDSGSTGTIPKGTAIVSYGPTSGSGGVLINGSGNCAPYMDVFTHTGTPWSGLTPQVRLGNLSGIAGYSGYGLWTNCGMIVGGLIQSNNWCATAGSCFNLTSGCFALGGSSSPGLSWDGTTLKIASMGGNNLLLNSAFDSWGACIPSYYNLYDNSAESTSYGCTSGIDGRSAFCINFLCNNSTKGIYLTGAYIFQTARWYVFSVWAKATGCAVGCNMATAWNVGPTCRYDIENPNLTTEWQRYSWVVCWAGATDQNGFITINGLISGASSLILADIKVEDGKIPTAYNRGLHSGEIRETLIGNGAITTDKLTANQIIAKDFRTACNVGSGTSGVLFNCTGIQGWNGTTNTFCLDASGNLSMVGTVCATSGTFTGTICANCGYIGGWCLTSTLLGNISGACQIYMDSGNNTFLAGYYNGAWLPVITVGQIYDPGSGWTGRYGIGMFYCNNRVFEISNAATVIAGWNFDCLKLYSGSGLGAGVNLVMSKENSGSGYAYANQQILQGYGFTWHYSSNAGHIILGQMMCTACTLKTDYYGIQMMDYVGNEFFALGAKMGASCYETYNRIAGWSFSSTGLWAGNLTLNSSGSISGCYSAGSTGWCIGQDGSAEFNNATFRGTVCASSGIIGGSLGFGIFSGCIFGGYSAGPGCCYYMKIVPAFICGNGAYLESMCCGYGASVSTCFHSRGISVQASSGACFEILGNTICSNCNIYIGGDLINCIGNSFMVARYDTASENYQASMSWQHLQLGNNGENFIIGGKTAAGGSLVFYSNNTTCYRYGISNPDGYRNMVMYNGGAVLCGTVCIPSHAIIGDNTYAGPTLCLGRLSGQASIKSADTWLVLESCGGSIGLNYFSCDQIFACGCINAHAGAVLCGTVCVPGLLALPGGMPLCAGGGDQISGIGFASSYFICTYAPWGIHNHTGVVLSGHANYGGVRIYSGGYPDQSSAYLQAKFEGTTTTLCNTVYVPSQLMIGAKAFTGDGRYTCMVSNTGDNLFQLVNCSGTTGIFLYSSSNNGGILDCTSNWRLYVDTNSVQVCNVPFCVPGVACLSMVVCASCCRAIHAYSACVDAVWGCAVFSGGVVGTSNCYNGVYGYACYMAGVYGQAAYAGVLGCATTACAVAGNTDYCNTASIRELKISRGSICALCMLRNLPPVERWIYRDRNISGFDEAITPYAEDWGSATGLSSDGMSAASLGGVAIQGVKELDSCTQDLLSCINELSARLAALEKRLSDGN
jgi:hypothetical protein